MISIPTRGFTLAEFEQRTQKIQSEMAQEKLDALLLTTEPNVRYFSGFQSQFWESPTRPWFLVVPAEGKPVAVIPEIGWAGMQETWIEDIRTWKSPCPEDDGISLLEKTISQFTTKHKRLGVTLGQESHLRMPNANFKKLTENLRSVEIVDTALMIHRLRKIKSEQEIQKIAYICDITSAAFNALPEVLRLGESERQSCLKLRQDLLNRGADHSPYMIAGSGQGGYDNIIMGPTDRILNDGDVLIIDTGSTYDGYFCDFDRNFAFGHLDDQTRKAYEVVFQSTEAGFQAARPGNTTTDIWAAMWKVLEEGGALGNSVGRMGHGLGMQLTEWPSVTAEDNTLLEPGMIVTLEPGMTFAPNQQMVHEENLVITEDGALMLSKRAPVEMPLIET